MSTPAQPPPPRPAVMGPYKPDWMEKPSADDLSDYYPDHAARNDIPGKATIICKVMPEGRLSDCKVASERPAGEHFGEAALKLAPKFRMIPPDDPSAAPATVTVPLIFEVPKPEDRFFSLLNGGVRVGFVSERAPPEPPPLTANQVRHAVGPMIGLASAAAILLVAMIWGLGRRRGRSARNS